MNYKKLFLDIKDLFESQYKFNCLLLKRIHSLEERIIVLESKAKK